MAANFGLIAGNPFYLSTLGLAIIGWIITLAGAAAAQKKGVIWFYIFYELVLILGIAVSIATNSIRYYRLAFIGFLSASISWISNYINDFLASRNPPTEDLVIASGEIFLSIVTFVWIITLGAEEGSLVANSVNSMALSKSRDIHPNSPNNPFPAGVSMNLGGAISLGPVPVVSPNADYAYKAKALYDYQANPDDQNEISFTKGEILDIVDNKGKWWQAKKVDGTIGIAPSNYLELI